MAKTVDHIRDGRLILGIGAGWFEREYRPIPILIGGEGEQVLLKLVAGHADIWNGFGPAQHYRRKCEVLDRWCAEVGRDPAEIERSVMTPAHTARTLDPLVEAGTSHIIMNLRAPWKFSAVEKPVRWHNLRR
jgi:alkanesulfonate monooxygenase SsuD/methylene tetrahydromethanopterin reductase-like flavin-dependent oxidoreductase (luciferase family)